MPAFPSPLHPAVVHFPIVLILIGTVFAIAAILVQRWHLRLITAALLVLGAGGTMVAVETGEEDGEVAAEPSVAADSLLDAHETWAERTLIVASLASVIAIGAAVTLRWPAVSQSLAIGTLLTGLFASWCVYETGHRGGQLVYNHGVGVLAKANLTNGGADMPGSAQVVRKRPRDDDN